MEATRLLRSCTTNTCGLITKISRVFPHSARTLSSANSFTYSTSASDDILYRKIIRLKHPNASIAPMLNQWIGKRGGFVRSELQNTIKLLKKSRRFNHALLVSEWMTNRSYPDPITGDVAVQLDLIFRVHGLEKAEQYFKNIPNSMRNFCVYGALLNCYVRAKSLDKAESTMQKLREMELARNRLNYNSMLELYSQIGNQEKLELLLQEMEEKGIAWDEFTFSIQLNAYATIPDVEKMEKILMKMEEEGISCNNWEAYVIAANAYLKAGLVEKAMTVLKKSELLITCDTKILAHEILLTLYRKMGQKDEVHRLWNLCKKTGKVRNQSYFCMISSLAKLGDLDGMAKIFEEWEAAKTNFDIRIYNYVISAYCRNGLLDKAEAVMNMILDRGQEPNVYTWGHLATGCAKHNIMEKAVDTMKKAILVSNPTWKPNLATLSACIEYLKGKGHVEVDDFRTLLKEKGHLSKDMYGKLEHLNEKGIPGSATVDQMENLDGEANGVEDLSANLSEKDLIEA